MKLTARSPSADYLCGSYRATSQWFANLDNIKETALIALEEVTFFPPACMWFLWISTNGC